MKVVHLPIAAGSTPLHIVLRAMRIQQRSAVLRESHVSLDLIEIPDLFTGMVQQLPELSSISDSKPVHRLSQSDISTWNLNVNQPDRTPIEYEQMLDSVQRSYVLIDAFSGTALMITRHETEGDEVEVVPRQCQCRGPLRHGYPYPHKSTGDGCDTCPFPVDCF